MTKQTDTELTLVIPVLNAQDSISQTVSTVMGSLRGSGLSFELIVVDDGSKDNTREALKLSQMEFPELKVLRHKENRGKGAAVSHAFSTALGKYLLFIDADLAYPIDEIYKILAALKKGADVAVACRVLDESRFIMSPNFFHYLYTRHVMGRFFNFIVRLLVIKDLLDTQAGLKGFRREAATEIFKRTTLKRFSFDVEVLFLAQRFGYSIAQVGVNFIYYQEATTVNFAQDTISMLADLL